MKLSGDQLFNLVISAIIIWLVAGLALFMYVLWNATPV